MTFTNFIGRCYVLSLQACQPVNVTFKNVWINFNQTMLISIRMKKGIAPF